MRVELRSHGGFAGLRRPPVVLETDELPPGLAREVEGVAARVPASGPPGRGADFMTYEVVVEDAEGRRSASFSEPDVPDAVRDLLRLAREARGRP